MAANVDDLWERSKVMTDEEREVLVNRLMLESRMRPLTPAERLVILDSITLDLGALGPEYSDDRADWYDDEQ